MLLLVNLEHLLDLPWEETISEQMFFLFFLPVLFLYYSCVPLPGAWPLLFAVLSAYCNFLFLLPISVNCF